MATHVLNFRSYDDVNKFSLDKPRGNANGQLLRIKYPGRSEVEWMNPPMRVLFPLDGPGIDSKSKYDQKSYTFTCVVDHRGGAPDDVIADYKQFLSGTDQRLCALAAESSEQLFGMPLSASALLKAKNGYKSILKYHKDKPDEYAPTIRFQMIRDRDTGLITSTVKVRRDSGVSEALSHDEIIALLADSTRKVKVIVRSELPFAFNGNTGLAVVPKVKSMLVEILDDGDCDVVPDLYDTAPTDIPYMPLPSMDVEPTTEENAETEEEEPSPVEAAPVAEESDEPPAKRRKHNTKRSKKKSSGDAYEDGEIPDF